MKSDVHPPLYPPCAPPRERAPPWLLVWVWLCVGYGQELSEEGRISRCGRPQPTGSVSSGAIRRAAAAGRAALWHLAALAAKPPGLCQSS